MFKYLLIILFPFIVLAEIPISQLPLITTPATIQLNDSFPMVSTLGAPSTKRLYLKDLLLIPSFIGKFSLYAPLASPTFTGTVTGTFSGNLSGTATNVTGIVAVANGGTGASTANNARNNLLPSQSGKSGLALLSNGSDVLFSDVVRTVNTYSGDVSLTKSDIGLGSVDNTSDINKPVSSAQASADATVQAYAIQRANHTGTQLSTTISDFSTAASAAAPVQSVFGRTGIVVAVSGDYSAAQVGADASGSAGIAQAFAIQRANHTGTQLAATISNFNTAASAAAPVQSVAGQTGTVVLTKYDVGLGNVDNTSDATKNAASVTLTNKSLTSPILTGTPTAPTAASTDNSTTVATTAYVKAVVAGISGGSGTAPNIQRFLSGSGTYARSGTPTYIKVRMVGAGGGGSGSGNVGSAGGSTTFGANTCTGGGRGNVSAAADPAGSCSISLGTSVVNVAGAVSGGNGLGSNNGWYAFGATGGSSPFGGAGGGGSAAVTQSGFAAVANTGSGGGGGWTAGPNGQGSSGGSSGGYLEFIVTSPATTYPYSIGAGGSAGGVGGAGGSGVIIVEEYY